MAFIQPQQDPSPLPYFLNAYCKSSIKLPPHKKALPFQGKKVKKLPLSNNPPLPSPCYYYSLINYRLYYSITTVNLRLTDLGWIIHQLEVRI